MCPRVQRIIGIFLRIFGARKIRVALEHKGLARVLEGKMNIFHLRKIFQAIFLGWTGVKWWIRRWEGALGLKSKYTQVIKSKWNDSKLQIQTNSAENQAKKRGQKRGCDKPPPLRMNLVLEIRLLGKTILDNMPLEILLIPRLILTRVMHPLNLVKLPWLTASDSFHLIQNFHRPLFIG